MLEIYLEFDCVYMIVLSNNLNIKRVIGDMLKPVFL